MSFALHPLSAYLEWNTDIISNSSITQSVLRAKSLAKIGDHGSAIQILSEALTKASTDAHVLFELRSLCYLYVGDLTSSLSDAMQCIKLKPSWERGWVRLGTAHLMMDTDSHYVAAISAYQKGLSINSGNEEMKNGLHIAQNSIEISSNRRRKVRDDRIE